MGHALRITPTAKMGPVVAAMAAVAASTLVAAAILGHSLGPLPIENPALALEPGSGNPGPLIVHLPSAPVSAPAAGLSGVLLADQVAPVPPAAADELLPNQSQTGTPITSITGEERVEPVPPEEGLIGQVQQRLSEVVRALSNRGPASVADELIETPRRKQPGAKGNAAPIARVEAEPVTSVSVTASSDLVTTPKDEVLEVIGELPAEPADVVAKAVEAATAGSGVTEIVQPAPTAAGSASPDL